MAVKRMDNVGIVVENLDAAIEFFTELGLTLEGRMPIEGEWAGRVTGVRDQRVEIAMLRTPDGHSRLELSRFDAPAIASDHRTAPAREARRNRGGRSRRLPGRLPALLHPRARGHSHRAGATAREAGLRVATA